MHSSPWNQIHILHVESHESTKKEEVNFQSYKTMLTLEREITEMLSVPY